MPHYINQLSALGYAYHIAHSPTPGDFILPQPIYRVLRDEHLSLLLKHLSIDLWSMDINNQPDYQAFPNETEPWYPQHLSDYIYNSHNFPTSSLCHHSCIQTWL